MNDDRAISEPRAGQVSRRAMGVALTAAAAGFTGTASLMVRGKGINSAAAPIVPAGLTSSVTEPAYIGWLSPSGDTTGAADAAAINSALASYTVVILGPGHWYVDAPIVLPSWAQLTGWGAPANNSFVQIGAGTTISATSGFTTSGNATGVISMVGGSSATVGGQRISNLLIDCSLAPAGVDGICGYGNVYGVVIEDVATYETDIERVRQRPRADQWLAVRRLQPGCCP
jgi:hypothetical protein